jgi:hypothetical protein
MYCLVKVIYYYFRHSAKSLRYSNPLCQDYVSRRCHLPLKYFIVFFENILPLSNCMVIECLTKNGCFQARKTQYLLHLRDTLRAHLEKASIKFNIYIYIHTYIHSSLHIGKLDTTARSTSQTPSMYTDC